MSWADEIRCLYCDGRLPLYRKITNGQFCSAAHRKAYWQEQERLAVERLHQTHDSLRAYKPRGPVEAILGKTDPELAAFEIDPHAERPAWLVQANTGEVPCAGFLRDSAIVRPHWLEDRIVLSAPGFLPATLAPLMVCAVFDRAARVMLEAGAVEMRPFEARSMTAATRVAGTGPAGFNIVPVRAAAWLPRPATVEMEDVQAPAPLAQALFMLGRIAPVSTGARVSADLAEPLEILFRVQLPLLIELAPAALMQVGLRQPGLRQLPVKRVELMAAPADSLRALDLRSSVEAPELNLQTPPMRPRLRLASGRRYPVESSTLAAAAVSSAMGAVEPSTLTVSMPQRNPKILRAAAGVPVQPAAPRNFEPAAAGLLPLDCTAQKAQAGDVRPAPSALSIPQSPRPEPMRPASKLEPLADFMATPPISSAAISSTRPNILALGIDFWNRAPRDLKILTFAIPVLIGLALHPALPKVRVAAPAAATGLGRDVETAVNTQWASFKQTVFDRAAVALDEDFRSGLDDWASRGNATTDWSFDATGFVRPGPLALYRPSMGLSDYQLQFLGMIDKKALSWVVRAADFDNYYVVKLEVLKPGPVPTVGVTRYAVVNGKADARADVTAPIDARNDMLYRVRMDVHGDEFSLWVQGQMIDAWSEPRLAHGGVGFFSAHSEQSRLRWVQVTHQYDMLGRLCAYLAPYNIPPATGSIEQ